MSVRVALCLWLLPLSLASAQSPLLKAPAGFAVELILQAPDIEAPTALCVAPNGDVYYAEDPMDMRGPTTRNIDKIWMLKGGDPKKKILIADQMWAVMGLEIVRDRLYVVHPPHVTAFTLDTEGKPRAREELFNDLGPRVAGLPGFNDHICSGIRMGADGWLYVSIGDKGIPAMTRKEKDRGSVHVAEGRWRHTKEGNVISLEGGGVIRFRPDGSGLEVFASGTRNHLDVPLDDHDRIFVRDNTNDGGGWNTRLMFLPRGGFMGYPWAFSRALADSLPLVHDFGGGSPCGGWVYLDDGLPEEYRGRVFHCEWGKGKVYAVKVKEQGGGFDFVEEIKFLDPDGTSVKDFRPFTIRPTADGRGFYVTDWAHNGWTNKAVAGRLWKVTYTGGTIAPTPRIDTTKASLKDLADALLHTAYTQRTLAQRELIARAAKQPQEVKDALAALLKTEHPLAYRHAYWIDPSLLPENAQLLRLTGHANPDVRIEVVRVLGSRDTVGTQSTTDVLANRLFGEQSRAVRVAILAALQGRQLNDQQVRTLYFTLGSEQDPFVRHLLGRLLREDGLRKPLLEVLNSMGALEGQTEQFAKSLCWLLTDTFDVGTVGVLTSLLKHREPTVRAYVVEALQSNYKDRKLYAGTWWGTRPEQQPPPARTVVWEGTPRVREGILVALSDKDADVRKSAVRALQAMNDPETLAPLRTRFDEEKDDGARGDIVRAIASLKTPDSANWLRAVASEAKHPESVRRETLAGMTATTPEDLTFLARLLATENTPTLQVTALEVLARAKTPGAAGVAVTGLTNSAPAVRKAAVVALGTLADPRTTPPLLAALAGATPDVRKAILTSLGQIGSKDAVPTLLTWSDQDDTQFEALTALAKIPDRRAVNAYLLGLRSKNADLRRTSALALGAIRDEVLPDLKRLVEGKQVPDALLPELRSIYSTYEPIATWALLGPFQNNGKVHPPQQGIDLEKKYEGAGRVVAWQKDRMSDLRNNGRVNLASLFAPQTDVVAYGYAEINSPTDRAAQLLLGSDDTMRVWLNGVKVFEFTGNRGWKYDTDRAAIQLKKGKNTLLVECGNTSGPWEFSVAVSADASRVAFLQGGGGKLDLDAYRAHSRKNPGNAERGRKLFLDVKGLACLKCHALGNEGGKVGPALDDVGMKYKREELMTSILEPSRTIANGYDSLVIETKAGKVIAGVSKGERDGAILVMDDDAKLHTILKTDIEEMARSPVSRMPNGLNEGMALQDFADLIAFLETCRQEKPK